MILSSKQLFKVNFSSLHQNHRCFLLAKQKKGPPGNDHGLNREQLLQLALAWDAIEVAKEHIIKDDLNDLNVKVFSIQFLVKEIFLSYSRK